MRHLSACVLVCLLWLPCVQLMERAKVSGSLELPPELLDVMQHLQQGAECLPVPGISRRSSMGRSSGSGRYSTTSRVSGLFLEIWNATFCEQCF